MSLRRPFLEVRRADFDEVNQDAERFLTPRARLILDGQKLIASGEILFVLPKRIALDLAERNVQMNELRVIDRSRHRNVARADDFGKIGVVAGMRTEGKTQAGKLILVHRSASGAEGNPHGSFVGKMITEIILHRTFPPVQQSHFRGGLAFLHILFEQMNVTDVFAIKGRQFLVLPRQAINHHLRPLTENGGVLESLQGNLTINFKLHRGHLQYLRAILESILGSRLRREIIDQRIGQAQEILQRVIVFVTSHATKRGMPSLIAARGGGLVNFPTQPLGNFSQILVRQMKIRVFRRHLTIAQDIKNLQPPIDIAALHEIRIEGINAELPLRLLRPMAFHTGLLEDGRDVLFKVPKIRGRHSRRDLLS